MNIYIYLKQEVLKMRRAAEEDHRSSILAAPANRRQQTAMRTLQARMHALRLAHKHELN